MLFVNLFADGEVLLECEPQGDVSIPVRLSQQDVEALAELLTTPEVSTALARLFLAGVAERQRQKSTFFIASW